MYKIIVSLLILASSFFQIMAQSDKSATNNELALKLPASSFLGDVFLNSMGFSVGLETTGENGWSFAQEVGYIFDVGRNGLLFNSRLDDINGIRLTSELRKYQNTEEFFPGEGLFISFEWDNLIMAVEEVSEAETTRSTLYRTGLTFNVGKKYIISDGDKGTFTIDLLGGGGLGLYPENVEGSELTKPYFPLLNFDVKIGYVLQ